MKTRRLLFLGIALALAPAVLLSGCGGSDSTVTTSTGSSTTTYPVQVKFNSLSVSDSITLQNNGGDDLTGTMGTLTFSQELADGASYHVTILTPPSTGLCAVENPIGTINGAAAQVTVTCALTTSVTGSIEDADTGSPFDTTIEARNPADDSVISTAPSPSTVGSFNIQVPVGLDFYLHADSVSINGVTYLADNLQIENVSGAQPPVRFSLVDSGTAGAIAGILGLDLTTDAVFAADVEDNTGTGIAGVTVAAIPTPSVLFYQQTDGSFLSTGATTTANGPSVIGGVQNPSAAATYTFTLSPDQTTEGYTIDTSFDLRLIPGEISEPILP